eukprot:CAMPEP_0201531926 /NCGR_PEP_ID=MMETSP0161_2-20130828/48998_1 /ASSEMBLY_ACC=CAM_ASM_000251 /TAXON_ID=180227 /ORGANISM="Neoparamoeba aestuarina, Strain SoJaBio B1-5/56/2" /LENGTH=57 /DNA_ID=CAMNT_0047935081 /DNA_START=48 /DNA_END=221 /DNA_ORIENTATION=+
MTICLANQSFRQRVRSFQICLILFDGTESGSNSCDIQIFHIGRNFIEENLDERGVMG